MRSPLISLTVLALLSAATPPCAAMRAPKKSTADKKKASEKTSEPSREEEEASQFASAVSTVRTLSLYVTPYSKRGDRATRGYRQAAAG